MDNGVLKVVGRLGYIGGGYSGYTETGSPFAATIGAQTLSVLSGYAGLTDEMLLGMTPNGPIRAQAFLGVFSQTNTGSGTVPVSVIGMDTSGSQVPSGTTYGVKAGFNFDVPVVDSTTVGAGANASVLNDGQFAGSANIKISGHY
jgi:hypothetical protein